MKKISLNILLVLDQEKIFFSDDDDDYEMKTKESPVVKTVQRYYFYFTKSYLSILSKYV
jgi:hypothetical protein